MGCDEATIRRIPFDPTEPGLYTKGAFDIRERKRLRRVVCCGIEMFMGVNLDDAP